MRSDYYLLIVYHGRSQKPLLSARYYFDKLLIEKTTKGSPNVGVDHPVFSNTLTLDKFKQGEIFLSDRLSGNHFNTIYRRYRTYIHALFYSELRLRNNNCNYIIMARKEKQDKLLTNYLKWVLKLLASQTTKKKNTGFYWVILKKINPKSKCLFY